MFGSLCPFVEVGSLTRRLALPNNDGNDYDNNDDGDGVTGDNDAMATGYNGSHCTCSFKWLCSFVEVGSLTHRLALPDNDDDDDDNDDNNGNGVMVYGDAMATGDNSSHCTCSFGSLCPFSAA